MFEEGEYLEHFGVKGMKWGQRKSDRSTSTADSSDDAKIAREAAVTAKTKGLSALSNKELQTLVTRMNLEQQYSTLNGNQSNIKKIKNGQDKVKTVLAVGTTVNEVIKFVNSPAGKAVKNMMAK